MSLSIRSRPRALAAMVAAVLVPAYAQAAPDTTLYGGGATLVGTAISGTSWFTNNNPPVRGSVGDPGSLAGQYTASTINTPFGFFTGTTTRPAISYCQTGSGRGKSVLNNVDAASDPCGTYADAVDGIGAPAGRKADFAATDSPYSSSEFQTFLTNEGANRTQPTQFPFVAAVISIIYNNSDAPASPITLTEKKICQVFSGQITNWRQLNSSLPSKPIKVVYRGDSSGTSFAFSNHLSAVCADADVGGGITGFKTVQTFGGTCSGSTPMTCSGGTSAWPVAAPEGSIAASGNGAVTTTVASTDGAIGFADIADTAERIKVDPSIKLKFALVSRKAGTNPATGQPYKKFNPTAHPASFKLTNVLTDQVVSGIDANGRPVKLALSNPPVAGCVLLADPDGYATAALNASGDYTSYPIVGVSYLAAGATGNKQNTTNLRAFLFSPFTQGKAGTYSEGVTTMGAKSGYMYVTGLGRNMKDFITRCVKA